jgi:3-oxoacyl-[acyl-carrier protein] reductase
MELSLAGKTALVTGASRGIGRAIALALGAAGARVIAAARSLEAASGTADEIVSRGGSARAIVLDIADERSVETAMAEALREHATIPLLVNNAGITRDNLLMRMNKEDWNQVIDTNLSGIYRICRSLVPSMVKARYGRIVNVTSVVSRSGNPGQVNYAAAKAGIEGFSRSLARELGSRNITVNCVAPGFIDTDMTRALPDAKRAEYVGQVPLGRYGTVEEIAAAVTWLGSDAASYVTGAVIPVDGGLGMGH